MKTIERTTTVAVIDADIIDVAKQYIDQHPLVLNPADDNFPGGCVDLGSGAAEESIFRRTNYHRSLTLAYYPIKPTEAVYSPNITVFKESENDGFKECTPYELCFIACPGIKYPSLTVNGCLNEEDIETLEKKIELIFQVAHTHGHSVLILTAFGCGAWRCPPHDVADAFARLITKHNGVFKEIVFAIKRNSEKEYIVKPDASRPDNYVVFKSILVSDHTI